MNHFALTIVGRDRAGIVSQVTKILFDLGCNIADSSCSILGGQFAMILILGHPELMPRQRQTDASNLFISAPASLCLKSRSYNYVTQNMPCWHKKLRCCI